MKEREHNLLRFFLRLVAIYFFIYSGKHSTTSFSYIKYNEKKLLKDDEIML